MSALAIFRQLFVRKRQSPGRIELFRVREFDADFCKRTWRLIGRTQFDQIVRPQPGVLAKRNAEPNTESQQYDTNVKGQQAHAFLDALASSRDCELHGDVSPPIGLAMSRVFSSISSSVSHGLGRGAFDLRSGAAIGRQR